MENERKQGTKRRINRHKSPQIDPQMTTYVQNRTKGLKRPCQQAFGWNWNASPPFGTSPDNCCETTRFHAQQTPNRLKNGHGLEGMIFGRQTWTANERPGATQALHTAKITKLQDRIPLATNFKTRSQALRPIQDAQPHRPAGTWQLHKPHELTTSVAEPPIVSKNAPMGPEKRPKWHTKRSLLVARAWCAHWQEVLFGTKRAFCGAFFAKAVNAAHLRKLGPKTGPIGVRNPRNCPSPPKSSTLAQGTRGAKRTRRPVTLGGGSKKAQNGPLAACVCKRLHLCGIGP